MIISLCFSYTIMNFYILQDVCLHRIIIKPEGGIDSIKRRKLQAWLEFVFPTFPLLYHTSQNTFPAQWCWSICNVIIIFTNFTLAVQSVCHNAVHRFSLLLTKLKLCHVFDHSFFMAVSHFRIQNSIYLTKLNLNAALEFLYCMCKLLMCLCC